MNLAKYAICATRLKATPAFDKFDLSSVENDKFAVVQNTPRYFTTFTVQHSDKNVQLTNQEAFRSVRTLTQVDILYSRLADLAENLD